MSRRVLFTAIGLFLAALLLTLLPVGKAVSREIVDVVVTNFPHPQDIEGTVSIEGPIKNATMVRIENTIVSPVRRSDTTRLVDAGTIVTDGFPYLVLSVAGQVKGEVVRPGAVGAILIPDEETVETAFHEKGRLMFPLVVESEEITGSSVYFQSRHSRLVVGFPRYRVKLYNTSDKTVEVDLYAYLTN